MERSSGRSGEICPPPRRTCRQAVRLGLNLAGTRGRDPDARSVRTALRRVPGLERWPGLEVWHLASGRPWHADCQDDADQQAEQSTSSIRACIHQHIAAFSQSRDE
mmetsp:Transcript_6258/g.8121  ORF Transcript_6258/g.8121 Transcript_6258/m.8121 type:complete len:106 (-) Transcript_6258:928-1245(-)